MQNEGREKLRGAALSILEAVWHSIDWTAVSPNRRMKIYDEFVSKMRVSANTNSICAFVETLCSKWGVRSLHDFCVADVEKVFDDRDLLDVLRNDSRILVLRMRERIEEKQEEFKARKEGKEKHEKHEI